MSAHVLWRAPYGPVMAWVCLHYHIPHQAGWLWSMFGLFLHCEFPGLCFVFERFVRFLEENVG